MIAKYQSQIKVAQYWIYFGSLALLMISLPTSRFVMTLSLVLLVANWLATGDFKTKFSAFFSNKPAIAFTLLYMLNIIGLMWTQDFNFALQNDLLHKLPTLLLPIIITTSPRLSNERVNQLLLLFIASVFAVTLIGLFIRVFNQDVGFRQASPFVPNVYFCMMLIVAAFQLPFLIKINHACTRIKVLAVALSLWFVFYIFFMRSLSGIVAFLAVLVFIVIRSKRPKLKLGFLALFIILSVSLVWLFADMYKITHTEAAVSPHLPTYTVNGNIYSHNTTHILRENGNQVYINIAQDELAKQWNRVSTLSFFGTDNANHELKHTLYRYMASKGLTKDSVGFSLLTQADIDAIENGIPNYLYTKWPGIFVRVHQTTMGLYMYKKSDYKQPSWSTLTERLDLWRASYIAFKHKPILGWGTGSIHVAQNYGLSKSKSVLLGKGMKPHSQYLYILLTLGVLGLLAHILFYVYFVKESKVYRVFMFNVFLIVFLVTFVGNNSIESQVGQNMFVLFSLLYWMSSPKPKVENMNGTTPHIS